MLLQILENTLDREDSEVYIRQHMRNVTTPIELCEKNKLVRLENLLLDRFENFTAGSMAINYGLFVFCNNLVKQRALTGEISEEAAANFEADTAARLAEEYEDGKGRTGLYAQINKLPLLAMLESMPSAETEQALATCKENLLALDLTQTRMFLELLARVADLISYPAKIGDATTDTIIELLKGLKDKMKEDEQGMSLTSIDQVAAILDKLHRTSNSSKDANSKKL